MTVTIVPWPTVAEALGLDHFDPRPARAEKAEAAAPDLTELREAFKSADPLDYTQLDFVRMVAAVERLVK